MARRSAALAQVNLLDLAPVRLAGWEEVDGRVVVVRAEPTQRGLAGLWERFIHRTSARRIQLDEPGSFIWRRLDGRATVGAVAAELRAALGAPVEPAEDRAGRFVAMLHRAGLAGYPGWDDAAIARAAAAGLLLYSSSVVAGTAAGTPRPERVATDPGTPAGALDSNPDPKRTHPA